MTTPEVRAIPRPADSARGPVLRKLRATALAAQLVPAVWLISAMPVPGGVLLGSRLLLLMLLGAEAHAWLRLRRQGLSRREALARLVPGPVLRFVQHELRITASLVRWAARRRHGVNGAGAVFSHGRDQATMIYGLTFACVVETVALSYLLAKWPVVHTVFLVIDVYTVLFVLGLHAASVTRPHVLAEGSLRIRQGAHVDVHVPLGRIAAIRRETVFTHEKTDGELNLPIGSQTSVTLTLAEAVNAPKFLGAPRFVNVIRLHADDPLALFNAVTRAHAAPVPVPRPPTPA